MTIPVLEIGIALFLAAGFGALGETVLWRRSTNLLSWNESFLVGAGTAAALLFPLSMLFRSGALRTELALLTIALVLVAAGRLGRTIPLQRTPARRPETTRDPFARPLFLAIALISLLFTTLNFRYSLLWDGFQVWASKAQLLYYLGQLAPEWYPGSLGQALALDYPPLVPLYEALLCVVRGGFDFDVLKPVFVVFYVSMLLSTFAAARAILPRRLALTAALLLALLPAVSTRAAAGGYADMPQAAFVAGVIASALSSAKGRPGLQRPLPWLIGSLTTVKSEGTLLAVIVCLAIAFLWWSETPRRFVERCREEAAAAAVIVGFFGLRIAYRRWVNVSDLVYGPIDASHLARAPSLLRVEAQLFWNALLDLREWALLWPAFLVAAFILLWRGARRERCLTLGTAVGIGVYSGIFLFSNIPPAVHIPNAYPRLLVHLAPAVSVIILLGYARARASLPFAQGRTSQPG